MKKLFFLLIVSSVATFSFDEKNFKKFYEHLRKSYPENGLVSRATVSNCFSNLPRDVVNQVKKDFPLFFAKTAKDESIGVQVVLDYFDGYAKDSSISALKNIIASCYKEFGVRLSSPHCVTT